MWIHGHSTRVEYPDRMTSTVRKGSHIQLNGESGSENWFHIAVPTAVIVDGNRLCVDSVMLRFRTNGATITAVHVYDGANRIATHNGLSLQPANWAFERFDVPGTPSIRWGLGISFKVEYGGGRTRRVDVSSAGGDFQP